MPHRIKSNVNFLSLLSTFYKKIKGCVMVHLQTNRKSDIDALKIFL